MRWIHLSILTCTIIVVWSAANIMWGGRHYEGTIKADGKGYYAHLPAIFIYNDLNFSQFDSVEVAKYYNKNFYYDYRKNVEGHTLNKYFAGTSLAMLPFFAIAHATSLVSSFPADGYSKWYHIFISIAAIAYMLATLYIMALSMRELGFGSIIIALAIPIILFATNWYYYVIVEPAMSHLYSIFFIALWVHLLIRWARRGDAHVILLGLAVGMIIFIRPVNAVVLMSAPMFFGSGNQFITEIKKLFRKPAALILGMLIGLSIVGLQLLIYKIQTGHFLVYSYEEEGFNFTDPQFFNILFSYKKGLFLYTPLLFIALLGFMPIARRNRFQALWLGGFLIVLTYILSSWWNWYYGGSFSSRAFIEYYPFFFWMITALFSYIATKSRALRIIFVATCLSLLMFCQFQTFQYRHMIIHWDNMTKEKYWEVFLKIKAPDKGDDLGNQ